MAGVQSRQQCMVYLLTYSRADMHKVPDREAFAAMVVEAFEKLDIAKVAHWVVAQEKHHDCEEREEFGLHYHMALKLTRRARWSRVRASLESKNDIRVNFSAAHNTYYSAFRYVTKEDENFILSDGHPQLKDPPATEKAIQAKKDKSKARRGKGKKKERYSTFDVVEIIRQQGINSRLELISLAMRQKKEGKTALAEFIANRGSKIVDEALSLAKEFEEAPMKLARLQKSRLELLNEAYNTECIPGCRGQWMGCALSLLERNDIPLTSFCGAIFNALELGRGKYRNIYIHGPANTGKTFMVSPLKFIYKAFTNPATGTFAWMGLEEAEVVILNDFRWHPSMIAWGDLLQLLEGDTVHLAAPKNFCSNDIEFSRDTPFFATADAPLVLVKGGSLDQTNTQMMQVRWVFFHFWRQIPQELQINLPPCPRCFARLVVDFKQV